MLVKVVKDRLAASSQMMVFGTLALMQVVFGEPVIQLVSLARLELGELLAAQPPLVICFSGKIPSSQAVSFNFGATLLLAPR